MIIGGLEKFTLIDYPEHLAAIIFTQGCNFRCHFCYNPMLVVPADSLAASSFDASSDLAEDNLQNTPREGGRKKSYPQISEDSLFIFLESRVSKLDAVVISGGEPCLHQDLPDFIRKIRKLGYKVKLDTNGTNPEMLKELIADNLLDYIAMDIKAPAEKYDLVIGAQPDMQKIKKSIGIIKTSELPYEFRTTVVPGLHGLEDIAPMGELVRGAAKWFLQKFESSTKLINDKFEGQATYSDNDLAEMQKIASEYVELCDFR